MTNTFDLVVVGADAAAIAATSEAVRQGLWVLVVIRSRGGHVARRLRQSLRLAKSPQWRVKIVTGAEIACADGVNGVEAVVLRDLRTGRLRGFNTAGLRRFSE